MCHAGMGARKATKLERSLERVFRKAGGRAIRQPSSTHLLGEVIPKEDMAALFPGGLNLEETKKNGVIAIELADALLLPPSALKDAVIDEVRTRLPEVDEKVKEANYYNTIRFDLCLGASFPADSPRQFYLDHVIVHETSESYQDAMIAHLEGGEEPTKSMPFRRAETAKHRRYCGLMDLTKHLEKQRVLDFQPSFLFPVISALGYVNEDAVKMTRWMHTVMNKCVTTMGDDGIAIGVIKHRYKVDVRNAICFGVLRGNALAMHNVGPFV